MDINLRGVQICVSQPLLQLKRRDPLLGFIRCKRMPEGVTARPFGNACVFAVFHHKLSDAPLRNGLILVIQKEDVGEVLWSNGGIPVRRDDLVSVVYSTELNSTTSFVPPQRTDR